MSGEEPIEVKAPNEEVEAFNSWVKYKRVDGVVVTLYYLPHYSDGYPERWRLEVGGRHGDSLFDHEYTSLKRAEKSFDMVDAEAIKTFREEWDRKHLQSGKVHMLEMKLRGTLGFLEEE